MTVVAALCIGVACALAAGLATGTTRELHLGRHFPPRRAASARQLWLAQAGVALTPRQFWAGSIAVGIAAFVVVAALSGAPLVAVVPAAAVAMLPRAYFARQRNQRLRVVQEAWPDGLRDILASVTSGRSVGQALTALAATGPESLRVAFARFPDLSRMLGTVAALEIVKAELADPTSDRVIEVLILAHERGGAIVTEILEGLVSATTRDLKLREEIASEGLEMKINARAVLVIPWFMLLALTTTTPAFRAFYASALGAVVIAIGAVMSLFGTWLLQRLMRDDVEARVLS